MRRIEAFCRDVSGATAIEYGLLCALLSIVVLVSFALLGDPVNGLFGAVAEKFSSIEFPG